MEEQERKLKNRLKAARWRINNPEKCKQASARRRLKGLEAKRFNIKEEGRKSREYREFKKTYCEMCGFVPVDSFQLDVHHKDGQCRNNDPKNLQTLCANCHRLKHHGTKIKYGFDGVVLARPFVMKRFTTVN